MIRKLIIFFSIICFIYGCTSMPSVNAPILGKTTFLQLTNQDTLYVMFSLTEKGEVLFEKILAKPPKSLLPIYKRNIETSESVSKEVKKYRDCIIINQNRIHKPCAKFPIKGSPLTKNELTGVGLIAGAIMSPFIIFEATLQTLTGDTQGAKKKMGEFNGALDPRFNQKNINSIGDSILKELTDGYEIAVENSVESSYLIQVSRTVDEVTNKAKKITLAKAQEFLIYQNIYQGKADGVLGNKTANAISVFQKHEHLEVTGQLDESTKIALVDKFQETEFEYILASRKNSIESYSQFLKNNPQSKNIARATSKKNELEEIQRRKVAKKREKQRIAIQAKRRQEQAVERRKIQNEINNATWERGDLAYLCRKKFWNLFSDWETCDARILDVTSNKANIEFEWGCGIGWEKGDTKWVDLDMLYPRDNCDSYMHLLE